MEQAVLGDEGGESRGESCGRDGRKIGGKRRRPINSGFVR